MGLIKSVCRRIEVPPGLQARVPDSRGELEALMRREVIHASPSHTTLAKFVIISPPHAARGPIFLACWKISLVIAVMVDGTTSAGIGWGARTR